MGSNYYEILRQTGAARGCSMADVGMDLYVMVLIMYLIGFEAGSGREMRVHNMNRCFT